MVDCLRPFLKIACLQLPIHVFKEWIDRLGFSFFMKMQDVLFNIHTLFEKVNKFRNTK